MYDQYAVPRCLFEVSSAQMYQFPGWKQCDYYIEKMLPSTWEFSKESCRINQISEGFLMIMAFCSLQNWITTQRDCEFKLHQFDLTSLKIKLYIMKQ